MAVGNHGCVGQLGRTTSPVAWSWWIFCSTLGIRLKGGKHHKDKVDQSVIKASTAIAWGSGLQEM